MTLKNFFQEAVEKYGTQAFAAKAIGIDRTRISKVLQSGDDAKESLELANCLRLARALGRPPGEVLVAVGKADDHALIQELYGDEQTPRPFSAEEATVLALMRQEKGSDEVSRAVREIESPRAAIRAWARAIERMQAAMLAQFERAQAEAGRYRAISDPYEYWMYLETTLSSAVVHALEVSLEEEMGRDVSRILRAQYRDIVNVQNAGPTMSGGPFDDWVDPGVEHLRKLAIEALRTASATDRDRFKEAEKAIDSRLREARARRDDPQRDERLTRLRRLHRLSYHAWLQRWFAGRRNDPIEVDYCDDALRRYAMEMDDLLRFNRIPPTLAEPGRGLNRYHNRHFGPLPSDRAPTSRELDDAFRELAASSLSDDEAMLRLKELNALYNKLYRDPIQERQAEGADKHIAARDSSHRQLVDVESQLPAQEMPREEFLAEFWRKTKEVRAGIEGAMRQIVIADALEAEGLSLSQPDPEAEKRTNERLAAILAQANAVLQTATPEDDLPMRRMLQELSELRDKFERLLRRREKATNRKTSDRTTRVKRGSKRN